MNITSLAHVCLQSRDLKKTTRFYCKALGMRKLFNFTKNGRVIGFYLKASNGTYIEVFQSSNPKKSRLDCNLSHFCLETKSIRKVRRTLVKAGYRPTPITLGCDQSYQFWVKDPHGVNMEFHQYTRTSSQKIGKDVEINW